MGKGLGTLTEIAKQEEFSSARSPFSARDGIVRVYMDPEPFVALSEVLQASFALRHFVHVVQETSVPAHTNVLNMYYRNKCFPYDFGMKVV